MFLLASFNLMAAETVKLSGNLYIASGFDDNDLVEVVSAAVFIGNNASRRVLLKNHFRLVETKKAAVIKKGRPVDEWIFNITNYEYKA
jgi:RimJ/RimL family protein N-acetyltransferase